MKRVKHYRISTHMLGHGEDRLWRLDLPPRNIYVAASLKSQVDALRFAIQLQDAGFCVTSRWLRNDFSKRPTVPATENNIERESAWRMWATYEEAWGQRDVEDLEKSDTLIILANQPSSSGGFHFELGHFVGSGKKNIITVGDRPNVFFWHDSVRFMKELDGLIEWLQDPSHGTTTLPPLEISQEPVDLFAGPGDKADAPF